MKQLLIFIFTFTLLSSCNKTELIKKMVNRVEQESTLENRILGTWANRLHNEEFVTLNKQLNIPDDQYSITFFADGTILEVKNAGWCGTPPISYAEFGGTWETKGDTVFLEAEFWGGTEPQKWFVHSINENNIEFEIDYMPVIFSVE